MKDNTGVLIDKYLLRLKAIIQGLCEYLPSCFCSPKANLLVGHFHLNLSKTPWDHFYHLQRLSFLN